MNGVVRRVLPSPGPLVEDPAAELFALAEPDSRVGEGAQDRPLMVARAMLASALGDVERGAFDEQIITLLAAENLSVIAAVVSLMRRCRQAGARTGLADAGAGSGELEEAERLGHVVDAVVEAAALAEIDRDAAGPSLALSRLLAAIESAIGGAG